MSTRKTDKIDDLLTERVRSELRAEREHNCVSATLRNITRRTLQELRDALEASSLVNSGNTSVWRFAVRRNTQCAKSEAAAAAAATSNPAVESNAPVHAAESADSADSATADSAASTCAYADSSASTCAAADSAASTCASAASKAHASTCASADSAASTCAAAASKAHASTGAAADSASTGAAADSASTGAAAASKAHASASAASKAHASATQHQTGGVVLLERSATGAVSAWVREETVQIPVRTRLSAGSEVVADLDGAQVRVLLSRVSRVQPLELQESKSEGEQGNDALLVIRRQFARTFTYTSAHGYEFVLSISTCDSLDVDSPEKTVTDTDSAADDAKDADDKGDPIQAGVKDKGDNVDPPIQADDKDDHKAGASNKNKNGRVHSANPLSVCDLEAALLDSRKQIRELTVRFHDQDLGKSLGKGQCVGSARLAPRLAPRRSMLYHSLNCLHLLLQCLRNDLRAVLDSDCYS